MPYLEPEESVDRFRPGWDNSGAAGGLGVAGSQDLLDVEQNGSMLARTTGHVLLVEPAATERTWLRNELITGRMEVFEAADLITALRCVSIFRPSLILAQFRLPTYGGIELVRRLRQDQATRFIPVLLYSDMATADERVLALDLGAGDVLSKPFVGAEILARLRSALRNRQLLTVLEQRSRASRRSDRPGQPAHARRLSSPRVGSLPPPWHPAGRGHR